MMTICYDIQSHRNSSFIHFRNEVEQEYTVEEILIWALHNHYLAQDSYQGVIDSFREVHPLVRNISADYRDTTELMTVLHRYHVKPSVSALDFRIHIPTTIADSYHTLLQLAFAHMETYESFLSQEDVPDDVRSLVLRLHQRAIRHQLDLDYILASIADGTYMAEAGTTNAFIHKVTHTIPHVDDPSPRPSLHAISARVKGAFYHWFQLAPSIEASTFKPH